jgi:hypothetical protein
LQLERPVPDNGVICKGLARKQARHQKKKKKKRKKKLQREDPKQSRLASRETCSMKYMEYLMLQTTVNSKLLPT